jgi:two-component system response regulator MprA
MAEGAKILVIEDDPDYQAVIGEILVSGGYRVVAASSGEEGLRRVTEEHPDLIILDVMMERTISGFEVAKKLKNLSPSSAYAEFARVPILILTAIHQSTIFRFQPDDDYLPVEDFMEKPPVRDEVLKRVRALLALAR